jgi:hypothetical protein
LKKDFKSLCKIEGEWTNSIKFDDKGYWIYDQCTHYPLRRMKFTLPSDSTVREDLVVFKKGLEEEADAVKIKLEEIQRKDRKLREKYRKAR